MFSYFPRRPWLTLLPVLLALSCHPDRPTQTETEATAPVAAVRPDALLADVRPAPVPAVDSPTWHRAGPLPAARAPLIRPGGVRRQVPARDTAAPPPLEARLYDLTLKASEFHRIDPTRLTEVRGREGTVLRIPAGSLVTAGGAAPGGEVFVELKECYAPVDMLLSNLLTETTDDQLLAAAGMVLVRATAQGQPLRLAADHTVQIELPLPRRAGLQPYAGRGGRHQPVRWAALSPDVAPAFDEQIYAEAQPMPTYRTGPADLSALIRYPAAARARGTTGNVFVSLVVDETGRVLAPKVLRGLGDGCDAEALRVLRQSSGHWTPGQHAGRLVKVKLLVPVHFALLPADTTAAGADSTYAAAADLPALPTSATDGSTPATAHYVFNADRLGWLAAARPPRPSQAVTTLAAALAPDAHTSVRLVLPGAAPTILLGQPGPDGYQFADVPANRKAVLVGIRYTNGTPAVALRNIVTGQQAQEPLTFEETTLEGLEEELSKRLLTESR